MWVKICGVTTPEDALVVKDAGADAIGLNFAEKSPRCLSLEQAKVIVDSVREQESQHGIEDSRSSLQWVGVFVNSSAAQVAHYAKSLNLTWIQLHGDEDAKFRVDLRLPTYHAARIAVAEDMTQALALGGKRLLVDAKVKGAYGGTGEKFDWSLLETRPSDLELILAGGLTPENIGNAVQSVRPFGVDTASGVETEPGVKDALLVREFVARARSAALK